MRVGVGRQGRGQWPVPTSFIFQRPVVILVLLGGARRGPMARPQLGAYPGVVVVGGGVESDLLCFLLRGGLGWRHSAPCWGRGAHSWAALLSLRFSEHSGTPACFLSTLVRE